MDRRQRVVRFALHNNDVSSDGVKAELAPERAIETSRIGLWFGLAAILWAVIALTTMVI